MAVVASPGIVGRLRSGANEAGSGASMASTHQCSVPGVAPETYSRHVPSGRGTMAGRSSDSAPSSSLSSTATVSKTTPSSERATTTA